MDDQPGKYGKDFMKIKFNSDDNLLLNKILYLHNLAVVVWSVFLGTQQVLSWNLFKWVFIWVIKMLKFLWCFKRNWH